MSQPLPSHNAVGKVPTLKEPQLVESRDGAIWLLWLEQRPHQRGRTISSSALELMRATLGGALAAVLEVQPAPHTDEVTSITHRLWEFHIERRLRSTELLQ